MRCFCMGACAFHEVRLMRLSSCAGNDIEEAGGREVGGALRGNTTLTWLDLSSESLVAACLQVL